MLGAGDEIAESVLFLLHAPGIVPRLSQFAPASDMCNGEDHPSINKAEAIRIEVDGHREAIAAVPVKQQRRSPIARSVAAVDDRNRNARAVRRGGVQPLARVLGSVIATKNRLLFAKDALARVYVVVKQ